MQSAERSWSRGFLASYCGCRKDGQPNVGKDAEKCSLGGGGCTFKAVMTA